jgi:hypothetical protein
LSKSVLRKMSYISDQRGILRRYFNQEGAWETHLANTKNYIIRALSGKKFDSLTILGSGWLLDVPIDYLADNFKKVILYDINHPRQIRHKVRKFPGVELKEADISGAIQIVYNIVNDYRKKKIKHDLKKIYFKAFKPKEKTDYVISLNILNQLDILLVDYLKKFSIYNEEELKNFRIRIQKSHIDLLIPGKSCIIADYEEEIYNMNWLQVEKRTNVFIDLPEGKNKKIWQWDFDFSGTYNHGKKTIFNVVAMEV